MRRSSVLLVLRAWSVPTADDLMAEVLCLCAAGQDEEESSDDPVQSPVKTAVLSTAFVVAVLAAVTR